jgi:hypothetical protein
MADVPPTSAPPSPQPRSRPGPIRWAFAVVLLALAAWAAWHTYQVFQQRNVVEHIDNLGGFVAYDFEYIDPDNRAARPSSPNPIASLLGNDYTQDIVDINIGGGDRDALGDEDLQKIASLPEVLSLSISNGGNASNAGLEELARLPKLQRLKLVNFSNVTDSGLAVLGRLPDLRKLELTNLPKITDAGLEHLAQLDNLQELSISSCKIDGSGLQHVDSPALRLLEITTCQANDEALKHLGGADALTELSLGQNQIKGPGLSHLKALPKLVWLRLGENPLDASAAVSHLKVLTNLELLNLRGTPVDREAAKELSAALPKCDISIDGASYDPEVGKWDYEAASPE